MALIDNIVAYWKYDESSGNAADATGNGNTLTNNATTPYGAAKINNGLHPAAASSQYMSIADMAALRLTGDYTISCWVNADAISASTSPTIIAKTDASSGYIIRVSFVDKKINFIINSLTEVDSTSAITTGIWYFVAVTGIGSNITIYFNGSSEATGTGTITSGTTALNVARDTITSVRFWDGLIDEMGIWSRGLSASEISQLYNAGSGISYPFTTTKTVPTLAFLGAG